MSFKVSGIDLSSPCTRVSTRTLGELSGLFADENARRRLPPGTLAYTVAAHFPVSEGTPGGLFFGVSILEPGKVGDEFFMTRGHFHALRDRGEYYWGESGEGLLVLMTEDRKWRVENVRPGSLHYIPGHTAHRLVNTGRAQLRVGACWPSDAGHDYAAIAEKGFSVRILERGGQVHFQEVG